MDNILEKRDFLQLNEEEMENMSFLNIREIESVISSHPRKRTPDSNVFTTTCTKCFKDEIIRIFCKL